MLEHLWAGGKYAYWWTKHDKKTTWFPTNFLHQVPNGDHDIYFGVH